MASLGGLLLECTLLLFLLLASSCFCNAGVVEHTFQVQNTVVRRLCRDQVIVTVNGEYPGPTLYVHEGDSVVINVINQSPHEITIHWHGLQMQRNCWADGASYITQCPILPGGKYIYRFNVTGQEGTLWWHAHQSWLRATVHGAIVIYPKVGRAYPFEKPHGEIPIILGEWWNDDMVDVEMKYIEETMLVALPDALTINGQPGILFQCSSQDQHEIKLTKGKTYILRMINVGVNHQLFYKIANHKMTVVSVDGGYVKPYVTDVIYIAPGQSVDALLKADQPPGSYYMAAHAYVSFEDPALTFLNISTTGVFIYDGVTSQSLLAPVLPKLPDFRDTSVVQEFSTSLKGLQTSPFYVQVPQEVDEQMFIIAGLGIVECRRRTGVCGGPYGQLVFGNMNNVSFKLPNKMSILEAFYRNIDGVYTTDFPSEPPVRFDYTNPKNEFNQDYIWIKEVATKVKKLRYNTTVQIVFQNTVLATAEDHPIHLHGYNFHVLAQGYGNYDSKRDEKKFNLIDPPLRNTLSVPAQGWVVIRFRANNPGAWIMHCHLEYHQSVGLGTAFVVEDGPSQSSSLPSPPPDYPKCGGALSSRNDHQLVTLPMEKSDGYSDNME